MNIKLVLGPITMSSIQILVDFSVDAANLIQRSKLTPDFRNYLVLRQTHSQTGSSERAISYFMVDNDAEHEHYLS